MHKVAFIGTGGTIASLGVDELDLLDYSANNRCVDAFSLIEKTGLQSSFVDILPVDFRQIDSTAFTSSDWYALCELCVQLSLDPALKGIVIGHGTASLEETSWLLSLVLKLDIPVVLTGSMRPLSGISTDAYANLAAAFRVAAEPGIKSGVFIVVNDEIHSPRTITKTHTLRLNAFQSPWFGPMGNVNGTVVNLTHIPKPNRIGWFDYELLKTLPRVDIAYSHIDADGCAIRAFIKEGAKGIVSAGFGPGMGTPDETRALGEAVAKGLLVVQSSRTGAGQVVDSAHNKSLGIIAGSDLSAQKVRILLSLCLARGDDRSRISEVFKLV